MNGKFNDVKEWLIAVTTLFLCTLAAISIGLLVVINVSPSLLHIPNQWHGLSREEVLSDYRQLCWYLQGFGKLHWRFIPISARAIHHFRDVKNLIQPLISPAPILIITSSFMLWYEKKSYQLWRLIAPLKMIMVVYVMCFVMVLASFQDSFLWFHYVMFNNKDWVFDSKEDPIILLLQPQFFASCFVGWFVISFIVMVIVFKLVKKWVNEMTS